MLHHRKKTESSVADSYYIGRNIEVMRQIANEAHAPWLEFLA
jgi:hypothetical protein